MTLTDASYLNLDRIVVMEDDPETCTRIEEGARRDWMEGGDESGMLTRPSSWPGLNTRPVSSSTWIWARGVSKKVLMRSRD